jgi:hypothetical protein
VVETGSLPQLQHGWQEQETKGSGSHGSQEHGVCFQTQIFSGQSCSEVQTRSLRPGGPLLPALEPQVKHGPKIFSVNSANVCGSPENLNESILVINNKLEQRIIGVVNQHKKTMTRE